MAPPLEQTTEKNRDPAVLGSNQSGMRDRNERLVLSILRREGPLPKVEISRRTRLSAQTVSVIMRALEDEGLLEKGDKVRGRVGQPSVPMGLAPDGAYFFGLKVGRRSAELVLVNFVGERVARRSVVYAYPTPDTTVAFVRDCVADICSGLTPAQVQRIAGLGIASPYFLWEWGAVIGVDPKDMAAWRGFDLRASVASLFDFPVFLGNDCTCACAGELVFGAEPTPPDFLYVYIGYFIGGGIVLNGSLYTGSSGNAGAIGPFPAGEPAAAGRQLVDVASLIGLARRIEDAGGQVQPLWETPNDWSFGDGPVEDWLQEAAPAIAQMILSAVAIIDFSTVILDGSMPVALRERILRDVRKAFEGLNLSGVTIPEFRPGTKGADARPLGAASLPLMQRFLLEA